MRRFHHIRIILFFVLLLIPLESLQAQNDPAVEYLRYDVEISLDQNGNFTVREIQQVRYGGADAQESINAAGSFGDMIPSLSCQNLSNELSHSAIVVDDEHFDFFLFSFRWQPNGKFAPLPFAGSKCYGAIVGLSKTITYGQTQSRSTSHLLVSDKRVKNLVGNAGVHTAPIVRNRNVETAICHPHPCLNGDATFGNVDLLQGDGGRSQLRMDFPVGKSALGAKTPSQAGGNLFFFLNDSKGVALPV